MKKILFIFLLCTSMLPCKAMEQKFPTKIMTGTLDYFESERKETEYKQKEAAFKEKRLEIEKKARRRRNKKGKLKSKRKRERFNKQQAELISSGHNKSNKKLEKKESFYEEKTYSTMIVHKASK